MCAQAHCCQSNKMERLLNRVSRRHSRRMEGNERAILQPRRNEAFWSRGCFPGGWIEAAMVASRRCETKRRRTEELGGRCHQPMSMKTWQRISSPYAKEERPSRFFHLSCTLKRSLTVHAVPKGREGEDQSFKSPLKQSGGSRSTTVHVTQLNVVSMSSNIFQKRFHWRLWRHHKILTLVAAA